VGLFLNSNAKNLRFQNLELLQEQGRVVLLSLGNAKKKIIMGLHLVPKFANVLIEMIGEESKKISWEKPKPLGLAQAPPEHSVELNWEDWTQGMLESIFSAKAKNVTTSPLKQFEKDIEKKTKALVGLQSSLQAEDHLLWAELGEALKFNQPLTPEQEAKCDRKLSRSENRERAFQKAKDSVRKKQGTLDRVEILKSEIARLQEKLANPEKVLQELAQKSSQKISKGLLEKSQTQGRRLPLGEGFEAVIGKSAKDNLSLLRKSNSWDLWLHLKDYPGAHAIIHFQKGKKVPPAMIEQVATWVAKESLKKSELGGVFDVVVVEVRFVRPIKGDQLGRVTYHNPKTYRVAL
jgi:predicted ribosome quality control (RQC) complex YloA/Tae2 family protein